MVTDDSKAMAGETCDTGSRLPRVKHRRTPPERWYPLQTSPLYRLRSIHAAAKLFNLSPHKFQAACAAPRYLTSRTIIVTEDGKPRLIDQPVGTTLKLHYRLLELLDRLIRPDYLHSATPGRSHITNAAAHIASRHIASADIRRFFASTTTKQIQRFFINSFEMSGDLAFLLTSLCTVRGHLPLGSPASPLLSYFAHQRLFDAMHRHCKTRGVLMTLFYDDFTFSSTSSLHPLLRRMKRLIRLGGLTMHDRVPSSQKDRLITGVVIRDGSLHLPDRQSSLILRDIQRLERTAVGERHGLIDRIAGRIGAATGINKEEGRSLRTLLQSEQERLTRAVAEE